MTARVSSKHSSARRPPRPSDAVHEYAEAVVRGDIVVGKWVRLACERHLEDFKHSADRGPWFDADAADHALQFFGFLKHSKGEWAGKPLALERWQAFIIGSIFGWKREDGTRRFRAAYNELCRKNGKSTLAAGVGLYLAFYDGEPGAEVYSAATKRDQAKIVWGEASRMVKASPLLRTDIKTLTTNLNDPSSNSKFEPLGADEDSLDGLNIHGCIVDELHAHRNRKIWDVLDTAMGSRRQPVTFVITTAGFDRNSICWEQHDYGAKVLEGIIQDDYLFVFIASIDADDAWTDPTVWPKGNPNLGVSVKADYIREKVDKAKEVPGQQNAVRRLHMGEWTDSASRWLNVEKWDAGAEAFDPASLEGRECYGGLDLSTTTDITAFALYFPEDDGGSVLSFFWVPEEGVAGRASRDRVPYDVWEREGHIEATTGNVVDYDFIRARINELGKAHRIREIAYDPWNATQLAIQLGETDGFTMVEHRQGWKSMTAPAKELEKLVLAEKVRHGGNPVLRWMVSNVVVEQDAAGNIKPSKAKSTERIDGVVALIMAIGRAVVHGDSESIYETRGPLVF